VLANYKSVLFSFINIVPILQPTIRKRNAGQR
jgi:hypothetical protein